MSRKLPLRQVRTGVAVLLFTLFCLVFLGENNSALIYARVISWFQFIPSLLHFVSTPASVDGWGWLCILALTFLFGRVYCSFFCPLGILQDVIHRIAGMLGLKPKPFQKQPGHIIRYAIPVITLGSLALGTLSVLTLLDPYSIFGRIIAHLLKPLIVLANNSAASVLELSDIYLLSFKKSHYVPVSIVVVTSVSFSIIVLIASLHGRLYCNTFCPVGALLSLVARYSQFKIRFSHENCLQCTSCEKVCKAECINTVNENMDTERCVACFNCLDVCQTGALQFKLSKQRFGPASSYVQSKRTFLCGSAAFAIGTFAGVSLLPLPSQARPMKLNPPIVPPGSMGVDHFTRSCVGCHLCVSVCPTHTLVPTFWHHGLVSIMQPVMNFHRGHCEFSCNACGLVCPTGAINPVEVEVKKRVQLGIVVLNQERCIVHVKKKHCGACGEACPTNAISPVKKGYVLFPSINKDFCIGCGACEHACPTIPKSIFVTGSVNHGVARKFIPDVLPGLNENTSYEFPF